MHSIRNHRFDVPGRLALIATITALLCLPSASAQTQGQCISAEVDAPVVLPDGSRHPAGRITICFERRLSPVEGLHHLYMEGLPVSMSISRYRQSEGLSDNGEPLLLFYRSRSGQLRLEGYAVPAGQRMAVFEFEPVRSAPLGDSGRIAQGESEKMVLVAARAR